jgi:DNA-binding winged helix-turn-helix (wHTH) protein
VDRRHRTGNNVCHDRCSSTGATMDDPGRYRFGDCELDLTTFSLRRDGQPVHVEPQVLDVLAHLVRNHDRVVAKTELLDQVWGDRFVGESALSSRIKDARRAIGDDGTAQHSIRTIHGRGYRFVAVVGADHAPATVDADRARLPLDQHIRFAVAPDGTRIAYATTGAGPPLVKAANWMTHLDHEADIEVVVDAAGLRRFPLLGISQGVAVAIAFAVRHPDVVERP